MKPKKSTLQRLFPDTNVAAYYDPFSQIINLSKYDKADYESVDLSIPSISSVDKVSLFEHELTHWLDHISTLWGQRNIVLIYNALNAYSNKDIDEFWRIKHLFTSFSSDKFFHYFTEKYDLNSGVINTPWRYQITSGIRFSESGEPAYNKPILFARFSSQEDIPIIRVPISVAAILESNAINAEFLLKISMAYKIEDLVDRNIKLRNIITELKSMLYNKDFALYTVIAHLTSNLNNQPDVILTYNVAAAIGTTVLNIPETVYDKMELTMVGHQEWERRIKEFQNIKDKGFAFYNLLKNLVDKKGKNQYSIEKLLECSCLPAKEEMENLIVLEMEKNKELLIEGPFKKNAIKTITKGIEIFKIRGIDGRNPDFRENLFKMKVLPKLIFGDTVFDVANFDIEKINNKLNKNDELTTEETYLICDFYDGKFNEFVNACGI